MPTIIPATYTQSSVYPSNVAATAEGMTNGIINETLETGTNSTALEWIQMDFGQQRPFVSILVGPHTNTLAGGWGQNGAYVNSAIIEASNDSFAWTTIVASLGSFTTEAKTFATPDASYHYVRIRQAGFLAITEFYAIAPEPPSLLRPTLRSFVMDEWPQGSAKMRGGRSVRWAQVSAPAGASMELVWENVTHAQGEQIVAQWNEKYGTYGDVALTPDDLAGLGVELAALIEEPFPGAAWRFQGPPVAESVKAWRCTVRLPLRTRMKPVLVFPAAAAFSPVPCFGGGSIPNPLPPGFGGGGQFDPAGLNNVCITAASCERYQRSTGDLIDIMTTPGPAGLGQNCFEVAGPFNLAATASVGGTDFGIEFANGISISIYTQAGGLLKANLAELGPSGAGNGLRNPVFSFTITPVAGDPNAYLEWQELVYEPGPGDGSIFEWPGMASLNVSPPP